MSPSASSWRWSRRAVFGASSACAASRVRALGMGRGRGRCGSGRRGGRGGSRRSLWAHRGVRVAGRSGRRGRCLWFARRLARGRSASVARGGCVPIPGDRRVRDDPGTPRAHEAQCPTVGNSGPHSAIRTWAAWVDAGDRGQQCAGCGGRSARPRQPSGAEVRVRGVRSRARPGAFGGIDAVVANGDIGAGEWCGTSTGRCSSGSLRSTCWVSGPAVRRLPGVRVVLAALHPPGMLAHAAIKGGAEAFGRCLGLEVAHLGVAVGIAYLHWSDTDQTPSSVGGPSSCQEIAWLRRVPPPAAAVFGRLCGAVLRRSARRYGCPTSRRA